MAKTTNNGDEPTKSRKGLEDRLCKNKAYFFALKVLVLASIIGLAIIRN